MSDDETVIPISRARALRRASASPSVNGEAPSRDQAEWARRLVWLRRKAALRGTWQATRRAAGS